MFFNCHKWLPWYFLTLAIVFSNSLSSPFFFQNLHLLFISLWFSLKCVQRWIIHENLKMCLFVNTMHCSPFFFSYTAFSEQNAQNNCTLFYTVKVISFKLLQFGEKVLVLTSIVLEHTSLPEILNFILEILKKHFFSFFSFVSLNIEQSQLISHC
jgi:hypothetical protein